MTCNWYHLLVLIYKDMKRTNSNERFSINFVEGSQGVRHGKASILGTIEDCVENKENEFYLMIEDDGTISIHDTWINTFKNPSKNVEERIDNLIWFSDCH